MSSSTLKRKSDQSAAAYVAFDQYHNDATGEWKVEAREFDCMPFDRDDDMGAQSYDFISGNDVSRDIGNKVYLVNELHSKLLDVLIEERGNDGTYIFEIDDRYHQIIETLEKIDLL